MKLLISGANGQLGLCLQDVLRGKRVTASYMDKKQLDITNIASCRRAINESEADIWINCSAYTAVDDAENDFETANAINNIGVENIAVCCKEYDIPLIQVSTDYVFDGEATVAYRENVFPAPQGVYGLTKLKGEESVHRLLSKYVVVRTSWLYSEYKNNFVKTMLTLASSRDELSVVNDQVGSPTYAGDLAIALFEIAQNIVNDNTNNYSGLYHFANEGSCSWYEFSLKIFSLSYKLGIISNQPKVEPVSSDKFKTVAQRPKFSVLDSSKTTSRFQINNRFWDVALGDMLTKLKGILNNN